MFDVGYLLGWVEGKFEVESLSYVDGEEDLHKGAPLVDPGCHHSCVILELRRT